MVIPGWERKPFLVDTRALVSHYSFSTQHAEVHTDILPRYYSYANEFICPVSTGREKILEDSVIDWHNIAAEIAVDGEKHTG